MKDLTEGNPLKLIVFFALPILLGSLFQQAYSLTDTIIIGQHLGKSSLAAVGSTSYVVSLMFNLTNGLNTGFSIITARNFGAGDYDEMRRSIARSITFAGSFTVVIMAVVIFGITPILRALNTPDSIFDEARSYLLIVAGGLIVTLIYNLEAGILRAVGDSVIPLVILIIATVLNIGMDLLLVCVFEAGVVGAALATVIAQAISAAVCLVYLIKKRPFLVVKPSDFSLTKDTTAEMLSAGFGMALMYSIVDLGSIVLQNGINSFGEDIIAAHTAARKLFSLTIMPFSAIGATTVTYTSQNLGANKYKRISTGIRDAVLLSFGWAALANIAVFAIGNLLVAMIVPAGDTEIAATALTYLHWNVPFYFALAALLTLRSALQGLGKSIVPIIASIIELVWKVCTVVIMIPQFEYFGVIISEPIIWTTCAVMIITIAVFTIWALPKHDFDTK